MNNRLHTKCSKEAGLDILNQQVMLKAESGLMRDVFDIIIISFVLLNLKTLSATLNLSWANVATVTAPLLPFPLSSLAFP